ncbi:MAG: ATP-binding protein [Pseudomonadota bacterium]
MSQAHQKRWLGVLLWVVLTGLGAAVLSRMTLAQLRENFETDARIVHRLLSQRAVQHEAVMATLALLQPAPDSAHPEQRLTSVYPQILTVKRRNGADGWAEPYLQASEMRSRSLRQPVLAAHDLSNGRFELLLASEPSSYSLKMDMRAAVPWKDWPMQPETSPVRVALEHEGQSFVLQPGQLASGGWRFEFHKHLAADSQPFDVVAERRVGWSELPWPAMLLWAAFVTASLYSGQVLLRQRAAQKRAEELLRLGQVARLNTMGELAAGMAHELNQPLTALLASTQAAARLLADDPPEIDVARDAMTRAVEQARRASDVVTRLRRAVERPDDNAPPVPVVLEQAVRNALYLLEPELLKRRVSLALPQAQSAVRVLAEPVALEQIIHNLLMNALQALEKTPAPRRELEVRIEAGECSGVVSISDNGPGIPADLLPRVFEPFMTTRKDGLGLGLSLCESLAESMGGTLTAHARQPHGAVFRLTLPLASAT